jgi:hypothetical protein
LAFCAEKGWTEVAQSLLAKGVEVDKVALNGKTPIITGSGFSIKYGVCA